MEALGVVQSLREKLQCAPGAGCCNCFGKTRACASKEPRIWVHVFSFRSNARQTKQQFTEHFSPADIIDFQFAPITLCDIERSFSQFKNILAERRLSFSMEHLRWTVIFLFNSAKFWLLRSAIPPTPALRATERSRITLETGPIPTSYLPIEYLGCF